MAKIGDHERRDRLIEVAFPAHNTDVGKLWYVLARKMVQDASPQHRRGLTRAQELHMGDLHAAEHRVPAWFCRELGDAEPGLLLELTRDAALEIDAVDGDVV